MYTFRGIQTSFFGILMFLSTALKGQDYSSFTVRVGDEVTLPCGNLKKDQLSCDRTFWFISPDPDAEAVELVTDGKISKNEEAKAKSKRLRVTADCSLVVTNITREDVGGYTCRQYTAKRDHTDSYTYLSVVYTEDHGTALFFCTVFTYHGCWHKVQWLYEGDMNDIEISSGNCTAMVVLQTSHPDQKTLRDFRESLKCNVMDKLSGRSLQIKVTPQPSAEEKEGSTSREDTTGGKSQEPSAWSPLTLKAAGLAVLFMAVVIVEVYTWRKTKGMKTQRGEDTVEDQE